VTVIAVGGENFGMSKSTGNLQFSPTYRALLKNTIDLEERTAPGVAWRKATEYFVSVRNNFERDAGWTLEVKLSSRLPPAGARNLANVAGGQRTS
jgi:hypothetical protein